MRFIILARNPRNNQVIAIQSGDGNDPPIAVYATRELAERDAKNVPVCRAWPWLIVEAP